MSKAILVPLDGSRLDERALSYARLLARSTGSPLHLVRAVPAAAPAHYSRAETLSLALARQTEDRRAANVAMARTASRIRRLGHDVHTFVRFGRPSDVIVETSREQRVGLIVLATSGRRGLTRWWEGSVADEVVRWADVPVLLVRASDTAWSMNRSPRLMVALDGSSFAEAVLEPAVELANALAAEVLLARVVAAPALLEEAGEPACLQEELARAQAYLDGIGGKLPVAGTVTTHVRAGKPPVAGLERLARDEGADLVALATHGRGGLARLALGSTTTAMLQQSPVPLLVVRPAGPAPYAAQLDLEAAAPIPASI